MLVSTGVVDLRSIGQCASAKMIPPKWRERRWRCYVVDQCVWKSGRRSNRSSQRLALGSCDERHGRADAGRWGQVVIPGWPYSVVAALEPGRSSWTALLDAVGLGPADDETPGHRRPGTGGGHPAGRGRPVERR